MESIGTDIAKISRFKKFIEDKHSLLKFLSEEEIEYCLKYKYPEHRIAACFASKESIIKAFGALEKKVTMNDIKLILQSSCAPKVVINEFKEYNVLLSYSHESEYAVAFVLVKLKEN